MVTRRKVICTRAATCTLHYLHLLPLGYLVALPSVHCCGCAEDGLHCRWTLHAKRHRQLLRPSLTLPGGPSRVQVQRGEAQRSSTKCH